MSRPVALTGVVRGKIIELEAAPDLPDGQVVWVSIVPATKPSASIDGFLRAFGGWAEAGPELDEFLEQVRRDRKQERPAEP